VNLFHIELRVGLHIVMAKRIKEWVISKLPGASKTGLFLINVTL